MHISAYPRLIQDRALILFCTTYGMDWTEAVATVEQALEPREKRALSFLARFGAQFQRRGNGVFVPSESMPGTWYLVQGERCSCRDRGKRCKHILAAAEWLKGS